MNKLLLSATLSLAVAGTVWGQSKISADGLVALEKYRTEQSELKQALGDAAKVEVPEVGVIVMLAEGFSADDLEADGLEVTSCTDRTVIVNMPITEVEKFALNDAVQSLSFGGKRRLMTDFARELSGVNEVHDGIKLNGSTRTFKGKGVVLGMMDTGLQANHINFRSDNGKGDSRIQRLWHFPSMNGTPVTYSSSTIDNFTYDTYMESHGTHVAGIMGGSYQGASDMAYSTMDNGFGQLRDEKMQYYGVAPEADLALAVGELYDNNILTGVKKIISYAQSMGKPAVVNLSLGSSIGPHDGTDDFTATLNELGKEAIICISAGNEGAMDISCEKSFTADDNSFKTFLSPNEEYGSTTLDGIVEVWSSDSNPITVTVAGYRIADGNESPYYTLSEPGSKTVKTGTGIKSGRFIIASDVDANSNRYYVRIQFTESVNMSPNYYYALIVNGNEGQKINVYSSSYCTFASNDVEGYSKGSTSQTINCNACGENLISVGSYNTRKMFGILSSNNPCVLSGEDTGKITSFSSYGTMPDGTKLPFVLAPGATILSSYNRYYVESIYGQVIGFSPDYMTGRATSSFDDKTDYWGAMDGTSMASPFVAGVVALWLEAEPSLTVDDIKTIIEKTSTKDSYTEARPEASGFGKINAAEGLRYIFDNYASIGSVKDDEDSRVLVNRTSEGFEVLLAGEANFTVSLYDLQGRLASTAKGIDGSATIGTSGIGSGIYLLSIQGESIQITRKVTVR